MGAGDNGALIIGMGNGFRRDDGAGLEVVRQLANHDMAGFRLMTLSGDGTELLELWKHQEKVIIVDAVCSGAAPGTVHQIQADHLL